MRKRKRVRRKKKSVRERSERRGSNRGKKGEKKRRKGWALANRMASLIPCQPISARVEPSRGQWKMVARLNGEEKKESIKRIFGGLMTNILRTLRK